MKNKFLDRSGMLQTLEQAAVIGATLLCAAWYQHALKRMDEEIQKPKILIETLATPTVLPTLVDAVKPVRADTYALFKSATATPTRKAQGTPTPQHISVVTSTPEPVTTRVRVEDAIFDMLLPPTIAPEVLASQHATEEALLSVIGANVTLTPVVPPMAKIYTPVATPTNLPAGVATPTVDPNDPFKFNPLHVRVMDALDSVEFTILPVERDDLHNRWVFRWESAWAPPMLDGLTLVPAGTSPYTLVPRFVMRPYPFNFEPGSLVFDRYPVMFNNEYENEVVISDMDLPEGTYAFAVRGELYAGIPNFTEVTPWTEWKLIDIKK